MKAPRLFVVIALIIASNHVAMGVAQAPHRSTQDLLSTTIDNLELEGANIHVLLEKFSDQTRIPIGVEVSPYDDLSQTKKIRLKIKRGTLADALNSVIKQNPLYTWRIQDEVVNILPVEAKRDALLRDILEAKLEKFSINRGMTRFTVRQILSAMPPIKTILTEHNVAHDIQSFMSRDFAPLGREYQLEASNISVSTLLNQVVRDSQTKYWIVFRYGERKQYFVLNL